MSVPTKLLVMKLLHAPTQLEAIAAHVMQGTAEMVSLVQVTNLLIEMADGSHSVFQIENSVFPDMNVSSQLFHCF